MCRETKSRPESTVNREWAKRQEQYCEVGELTGMRKGIEKTDMKERH